MLFKCSGKYIEIYFSFKITFWLVAVIHEIPCSSNYGVSVITFIGFIYLGKIEMAHILVICSRRGVVFSNVPFKNFYFYYSNYFFLYLHTVS